MAVLPRANKNLKQNKSVNTENKTNAGNDIVYKEKQIIKFKKKQRAPAEAVELAEHMAIIIPTLSLF